MKCFERKTDEKSRNHENKNKKNVYSYHTFLFPFFLSRKGKLQQAKKMKAAIKKNAKWRGMANVNEEVKTQEEQNELRRLFYAQYQYFQPNVRKAIYGVMDKEVVENFVYQLGDDRNEYIIKTKKGNKKTEYSLNINAIRLKIFDTDVGVLIFELENREYKSLEAVKTINELGRRIVLPFVPTNVPEGDILCAESLELRFHSKEDNEDYVLSYDFRSKFQDFFDSPFSVETTYMVTFIEKLLLGEQTGYEIVQAVDDRMFTCCLVCDYQESIKFKQLIINGDKENEKRRKNKISAIRNDRKAKSFYEYIFIDKEGYCSAPTLKTCYRILQKAVYDRWQTYGSLYGVSHASLVCLTSDEKQVTDVVVNPFLTMYIEMAILVLVQRASIIKFQYRVSGKLERRKVKKLQAQYINYRNQLHFLEVSPQEQAIEMYELLQEQLYVKKEVVILESNLKILSDKVTIEQSIRLQVASIVIAVAATVVAVISCLRGAIF